jgi:hypothetical protein
MGVGVGGGVQSGARKRPAVLGVDVEARLSGTRVSVTDLLGFVEDDAVEDHLGQRALLERRLPVRVAVVLDKVVL